jgi:hypothetical protein
VPPRLVALVVAVLVTAGCGPGASSSSTNAPASPTTTTAAAPSLSVSLAGWKLPAPLSREVVLTDGQGLLVFGGQDAAHNSVATSTRFDARTGAATPLANLSPAVHDAAGVRAGNDNVIIAGGTPPPRATVQVVPATGAAQTRGQLPENRTDHVAAMIGNTTYVFGGAQDEGLPVASVFASTDGGATWRDGGTLAHPVRYPALAVAGGAVYLFGGVTTAAGTDSNAVQRYDPQTHATSVVALLPTPLSHASAVAFDKVIYVLGGFVNNTVPSAQIIRFDTRTNTVSNAGNLPSPLTDGAAIVVGDVGYLVGGEGPGRATTANVEVLKPA